MYHSKIGKPCLWMVFITYTCALLHVISAIIYNVAEIKTNGYFEYKRTQAQLLKNNTYGYRQSSDWTNDYGCQGANLAFILIVIQITHIIDHQPDNTNTHAVCFAVDNFIGVKKSMFWNNCKYFRAYIVRNGV